MVDWNSRVRDTGHSLFRHIDCSQFCLKRTNLRSNHLAAHCEFNSLIWIQRGRAKEVEGKYPVQPGFQCREPMSYAGKFRLSYGLPLSHLRRCTANHSRDTTGLRLPTHITKDAEVWYLSAGGFCFIHHHSSQFQEPRCLLFHSHSPSVGAHWHPGRTSRKISSIMCRMSLQC